MWFTFIFHLNHNSAFVTRQRSIYCPILFQWLKSEIFSEFLTSGTPLLDSFTYSIQQQWYSSVDFFSVINHSVLSLSIKIRFLHLLVQILSSNSHLFSLSPVTQPFVFTLQFFPSLHYGDPRRKPIPLYFASLMWVVIAMRPAEWLNISLTITQRALSHISLACRTIPCRAIPYHALPYHVVPYHAVPYHAAPYHTVPYHAVSYHAVQSHAVPYYAGPYHAVSIHAVLDYAVLCHAVPDHSLPYHAVPNHAVPYRAVPFHAVPQHVLLKYTYWTVLCN